MDSSNRKSSVHFETDSPHQSEHSSAHHTQYKKSSRTPLYIGLVLFVLVVGGLVTSLILIQKNEDNRNRAFSGYSTDVNGQVSNVSENLHFAGKDDIPENDALISQTTTRGLFYLYARQFKNDAPEFQEVKIPTLAMSGKVFYLFDKGTNTAYLFSRFENLPVVPGKFFEVWLKSDTENSYFHLATSQLIVENGVNVAYAVYVGNGDIKTEGTGIVYSFDSSVGYQVPQPEASFVTVNF